MWSAHRLLSAGLLTILVLSVPACASSRAYFPGPSARRVDQRAYEYGFTEGRDRGAQDAQARRRFDYERHRTFRNADRGYRGGDRYAYQTIFREGFAAGYTEGYQRSGGYAARGPSSRGQRQYVSAAAENGYRDGVEEGRRDRRDRKRFDPVGARRYRSGDDDYDRRYGSRDDYKREYRAGFLQGYEAGYRR